VKNDRVSHAYLFSGPRGTGKTTTARILAKALNCESPLDGDACAECPSCLAIARGSSLDVVELDAASNNGVDDIREIIAGAWHATPGRWKIYIFDEVHQLSKAASAALLKTLEEPPSHVVFVLATTDPHKVLPTIRSRTQHLDFRLLGADTLATLLSEVERAAGLGVDEATIEAAVRLGRGSARDALSALDQLVATGSLNESLPRFDALFDALVHDDAVAALRSLAVLSRGGWDPEQLVESFASEVRQVFLLLVAPDVADVVDNDRTRLSEWGERLGLARTVRVLESLGRALREMKSAPEKIVILEVLLVRLTKPELDNSYESLDERLTKLERSGVRATARATEPAHAPLRPIGSGVSSGARMSTPETSTPSASHDSAVEASTTAHSLGATTSDDSLTLDEVRTRFSERVIPRTSRAAQLLLRSAHVESLDGLLLTIALASEEMRQNSELIAQGLKGALEHEFHKPLSVMWTVNPSLAVTPAPAPVHRPLAQPALDDDVHDDHDVEGPVLVVDSVAEHLITEMFPGAEEIS
jgi:DNA polymerase-3 subunit gamma/tau